MEALADAIALVENSNGGKLLLGRVQGTGGFRV